MTMVPIIIPVATGPVDMSEQQGLWFAFGLGLWVLIGLIVSLTAYFWAPRDRYRDRGDNTVNAIMAYLVVTVVGGVLTVGGLAAWTLFSH